MFVTKYTPTGHQRHAPDVKRGEKGRGKSSCADVRQDARRPERLRELLRPNGRSFVGVCSLRALSHGRVHAATTVILTAHGLLLPAYGCPALRLLRRYTIYPEYLIFPPTSPVSPGSCKQQEDKSRELPRRHLVKHPAASRLRPRRARGLLSGGTRRTQRARLGVRAARTTSASAASTRTRR